MSRFHSSCRASALILALTVATLYAPSARAQVGTAATPANPADILATGGLSGDNSKPGIILQRPDDEVTVDASMRGGLATGACCVGGVCEVLTTAECFDRSGTFYGVGTTCAAVLCECTSYDIAYRGPATFIPGTTDLSINDDDITRPLFLPFPVRLYGATYDSAWISVNGNFQFASSNAAFANECLPASDFGPTLFPLWDDLETTSSEDGEGIFTATIGTEPNRMFVVEWRARFHGSDDTANFELILHENQSYFDFVYGAVAGEGSSATVGVQHGSAGPATMFSCEAPVGIWDGLSLRFDCGSSTLGACCSAGKLRCAVMTREECERFEGTFYGPGTTCTAAPCFGACCGFGGSDACTMTTEHDCHQLGGTYLGTGVACEANPCEPLRGACCFETSARAQCEVMLVQACHGRGGTFAGPGTDCEPAPCLGACCATADTDSCYITTREICEAGGGSYRGNETGCDAEFCSLPCGFDCPPGITVDNEPGECGAVVEYTIDHTGNCAGLTVTYNPPSGSFFPVGTTSVGCLASDGERLVAFCFFSVTVRDIEPPTLVCRDATISPGSDEDLLNYVVESFDDNCGLIDQGKSCVHASLTAEPSDLSGLPPGTTTAVTITLTDCAGNTTICTSMVTIEGGDCNANGIPDTADIESGFSLDCNNNGVPDECECFWCNVQPTYSGKGNPYPDVNAQLSHLGGGTPCGEKVADDFYLEPGCVHRITAVRGTLLTNSHEALRRARVEFYEDCHGKPVDEPFLTFDFEQDEPIPSEIIEVLPGPDGFSVVTYRFNLCDEYLWLDGGKAYWVSVIGLPDHIDHTDLSYWIAGSEHAPLLGSIPVKRSGTPGSAWGSCTFGPWESIEDCCIGCVNMDFCIDGYSCPILWDNGKVDLVDRGGSPSGTHRQYNDRTADSVVIKTCENAELCFIEAWIWTNCPDPICGFIEFYEGIGCDPKLADEPFRRYECESIDARQFDQTLEIGGLTFHLWRLRVKEPDTRLDAGRNFWISAGARSGGSFNANSFFAWSKYGCDPCNGAESYRITPGQHRTLRPPPTPWAEVSPMRDFAFRIAAHPPEIPPGDDPNDIPAGTPACLPDANGDGAVAVDDIFTFLSAWFAGCP